MKMRKFLAMLLTLSLVLSLSAPIALAVEDGDGNAPAAGEPAEKETPEEEKNPDTSGGNEDKDPGTESENPENTDGGEEKPPVTEPENPDGEKPPVTEPENPDGEKPPVTEPENPDGGEEKPPVTEPENPDGEKPPVNPGESENKDPENPEGEKPPVTEPENPDGEKPPVTEPENPGETEEPPYFVDEEGNKVDKDGYLVDDEGNQILDENGNPVKAEDKDKIQGDLEDINKPPLTPEEQEALDELGGKADAITGETSREELESIKNSPLYDRLTEEQKKAVEDALAALALLEQPVIPPVGGTLYERLMAAETLEEYDAIWNEAAADDRNALTADELAALEAHRAALEALELPNRPDGAAFQQPFTPPVEYTKVAPLTRPKSQTVSRPMRARASSAYANGGDGSPLAKPEDEIADLVTNKTLENGVLTIEAYSKADVVPADIVLVLDQSLMMTYCVNCGQPIDQNHVGHYVKGTSCGCTLRFNHFPDNIGVNTMELDWENDSRVQFVGSAKCGKSRDEHVFGPVWQSGVTNNASHIGRDGFVRKNADFVCPDYGETSYTTRQETLKNAVDTFMAGIAEKNENLPEGDRHRVAVVIYNDSASIQRPLSVVTQSDQTVGFGAQSGGNWPQTGLQAAYEILSDSGSAERNKVVVFLTDGRPGETNKYQNNGKDGFLFVEGGTAFDVSEANSAVDAAKHLKNSGATIYSVGIFNGADGADVGYQWGNKDVEKGDTNLINPDNKPDYSWDDETIKYANCMMHQIATEGEGHYLSTGNGEGLSSIFEQISNVIQPKVELGPETIVRDTITPYFQVKGVAAAKVVDIKTGNEVSGYNLTVDSKDNVINVSGFDFSKNYVIEKGDGLEGKKLVITIPIERKPEFWGGNQVPTNVSSASGIYTEGGTCVKPLYTGDDSIASPTMNVPLLDVQLIPQDVNIYYSNAAPGADALHQDNSIRVQYAGNGEYTEVDYGSLTWQTDYAKLSDTAVLAPENQTISSTEDGTYTVSREVMPTVDGPVKKGTATFARNEKANVNVFTPTVSFGDMRTYLTVAADVADHKPESVVWKHGDAVADSVEMVGEAPELSYDIVGRVNDQNGEGTNQYDRDYYAIVKAVQGNDTDIPLDRVTFEHHPCDDIVRSINFDPGVGQFLVHVFKPTVTFQDTTTYKGMPEFTAEEYRAKDYVKVEWAYMNNLAKVVAALPEGTPPELTFDFMTDSASLYEELYVKDTPVTATVTKIGNIENIDGLAIGSFVYWNWQANSDSTGGCTTSCAKPADANFTVHVKTCTLNIEKQITGGVYSDKDSFLFHVKGSGNPLAEKVDTEIFITGAGTKTITGLPVGNYSVTEDRNWSWRYENTGSTGEWGMDAGKPEATYTFTNQLVNEKWLSSEDFNQNDFLCVNEPKDDPTGRVGDAAAPEERETGINDEIPNEPMED